MCVCLCVSLANFSPEAADSSSFDVELGDIILTASDGLFDNMPDYMILQELKKLKVPKLIFRIKFIHKSMNIVCLYHNQSTKGWALHLYS